MGENSVMRIVYTFFLGLLLAVFVGVGINTFYEGPKAPDPNGIFSTPVKDDAVLQTEQRVYDEQYRVFSEKMKLHDRNVSIIALVFAVALVGFSLYYEKRSSVIANGVMLGGLFTLLYGVTRSFTSEDTRYIFAATTVALVVVVYLGYRRFAHVDTTKVVHKNKK
ncbi:hypothetical protein KA093_03345 [Candidatus Saccharibacteria bacterium]|nr:hypothetical protein [Candidatus Saccharibacteria bacterium]